MNTEERLRKLRERAKDAASTRAEGYEFPAPKWEDVEFLLSLINNGPAPGLPDEDSPCTINNQLNLS